MLVLAQTGLLSRVRRTGLLVLILLVVSGLAATAAQACNPGRTINPNYSYFDGWRTGTPYEGYCLNGSLADIVVRSPYVQSGDTSVWTMLYNNADGGLAQVGWDKCSNGNNYNFVEMDDADTNWQYQKTDFGSDPNGSAPEYKITYSANSFHFFKGGVNYYNWSSPTYSGCWAQQAGETQDRNSQMPGNTSDADSLFSNQVRHANDNSWHQTNSWANTSPSPFIQASAGNPYSLSVYGQSTLGNPLTYLGIWDKNCSSG